MQFGLLLFAASLSSSQSAELVKICTLISNPQQFVGKRIQFSAIWEVSSSRHVLRAAVGFCSIEISGKSHYETEFVPIYSDSKAIVGQVDHGKYLNDLAIETSRHRGRTLTTGVEVLGVLIDNFQRSREPRRGQATVDSTWRYSILIERIIEGGAHH